MIALLLGKLLARPGAIVAILAVAGFGWIQFDHWRQVRGLESQIAAITQERDAETRAKLETQAALSDVTANRNQLAGEVRRQNEAIGLLSTKAKALESQATVSALRAIEAGKTKADALRAPTSTVPPGNAAMNTWLQERFGGAN